jgi:hypothetical protein
MWRPLLGVVSLKEFVILKEAKDLLRRDLQASRV